MNLPALPARLDRAGSRRHDTACRLLRPPSIRRGFNEVAGRVVMDRMAYRGFLTELPISSRRG